MKVICLEDYYLPNNNAFPVCGAKYGEEYLALTKGKIYEVKDIFLDRYYIIKDDSNSDDLYQFRKFKNYNFRKDKLKRILKNER